MSIWWDWENDAKQMREGRRDMEEMKREENGKLEESLAEDGARERAESLYRQAEVIRRAAGIDVMEAFERDEGAREKVRSGAWDFADLARSLMEREEGAPRVARSPGGSAGAGLGDIKGMSQAEFDRLNEQLDRGYTFAG